MTKKHSIDELEAEETPAKPVKHSKHKAVVGKSVLYQASGEHPPFAAMISAVDVEGHVTITMFDPRGDVRAKHNVPYSEELKEGFWSHNHEI